MKVTDWFGPDVKPTIQGWYERNYHMLTRSQAKALANDYWDGEKWKIGVPSGATFLGAAQDLRWRGLAEKPE